MNDANRLAWDQLTMDIRQAHGVWSADAHGFVLSSPDPLNGQEPT